MLDLTILEGLLKEKDAIANKIKEQRKIIFEVLGAMGEFSLVEDTMSNYTAQLVKNSAKRSMDYKKLEKDLPDVYADMISKKYITYSTPRDLYKLVIAKKKVSK